MSVVEVEPHPTYFLPVVTFLGLALALACGSAIEQMESTYLDRVQRIEAAAAVDASRSAAILAERDAFAARYAALPTDPVAREAPLGVLNQDMRAAIYADEAAAVAAAEVAGAAMRPNLQGSWSGPGVQLVIDPGGQVHSETHANGMNTNLDAPLQTVTGTGFDVGVFGITTHFVVTVPPHVVAGQWMMTVDGVELTRSP
ncbi:MAG: hypothetical protein EXR69_02170 [Myxococcales bacterium]|nr:hypothetical protein [Myxococcales bacterium]